MRLKQLLFDPGAPPATPASYPLEVGPVFLAFPFIGPGRRSLDARLNRGNSTF